MLGQNLANYSDLRSSLLTLIEYSVCACFSLHFQMCYQYEKSISRKKPGTTPCYPVFTLLSVKWSLTWG